MNKLAVSSSPNVWVCVVGPKSHLLMDLSPEKLAYSWLSVEGHTLSHSVVDTTSKPLSSQMEAKIKAKMDGYCLKSPYQKCFHDMDLIHKRSGTASW